MNLMVDIQAGKFFAVRMNHDSLDDSNVFFHDKGRAPLALLGTAHLMVDIYPIYRYKS